MSHYVPGSADDAYEAENLFYLRSHPSRLAKLLAHYELYRAIGDLPGAVVELGVYKGASLVRFATFRSLLETPYSRPIIGFDAFGAFPRGGVAGEADQAFIDKFEAAGGEGIARPTLEALLAEKGFTDIELVEGDVFDTLPAFLGERPALKVALLHLDLDVYEPTVFALEQLLPRMVGGGLVAFDDYGLVEGATRAADEACARLGVAMEKFPHYRIPAFFAAP
jgi:hypothetical protein